jgi:hypothetical protein
MKYFPQKTACESDPIKEIYETEEQVKEHHSAVVNKMQNVGNPIGR